MPTRRGEPGSGDTSAVYSEVSSPNTMASNPPPFFSMVSTLPPRWADQSGQPKRPAFCHPGAVAPWFGQP
ncbi:MAG: hypothetical protein ACR2NU_15185 [Aeoliella sp.]